MTAVYLGICWLIGIWLGAMIELQIGVWLGVGGTGAVAGVLLWRRNQTGLVLVCLGAVGFGGARYVSAVPTIDSAHVAYYNDGEEVTLTGLVVDEPNVSDRAVNLRLAVDTLTLADGRSQPVAGLVLVRTFRYPVIEYGTRLQVNGRLETPPEFEDFSYKAYLARQGIHSIISLPRLTVLAEGEGSPLYHAIYAFKSRAQAAINRLIPDPQAALLSGILLGNDSGMPPDLADAFRATGMTHVIAISGFNIAILIAILVSLGEPLLGKRGAVIFAVAGVSMYTLLVGADASVVRAAIMGSLYLLSGRWLGRPSFAYASLFLAGALMTLINPFTLWDVGFQLSFAATLSLMLYADPLSRWTRDKLSQRLDKETVRAVMGVLSDAVLVTLAAQALTLPLMVAYFGQLSLISFPANALILPAQPGVMLWGGLASITGMVLPALGQLFGWVAWLFLTYTITLVRALATAPGAAVPLHISIPGIFAIYAGIGALTWLAKQPATRRADLLARLQHNVPQRMAVGGSAIAALLVISFGATQPDGLLHVAFLDVNQGDAIFIQTPSGRQILVDGGLYPTILNDQLGRQMPFWDREIDILVATHPDADHVTGLTGVFERYRVDRLITDGSEAGESQTYDAMLSAATEGGAIMHHAVAGEMIAIGDGVRLELLHPGATPIDDRNENSVSLRLVYGDFSLLLTGDAEEQAEGEMLQRGLPLTALVFKAGHHGSQGSSTLPFLQAVQPQIVVISAGAENRYGHPHPALLERVAAVGATVLRTDELGTIEVISDGRSMWWQAAP